MGEQEKEYISKVKNVASHSTELEALVRELFEIDIPKGETSFNTQLLVHYIKDTEFDYDNEALFDYTDEGDYTDHEQRAALSIKQNIEQIVSDIENANWYEERVTNLEFGYSRLKDGDYLYKIVVKPIEASTPKEANALLEKMKHAIPREHPEAPDYTLEYTKALVEIVDSADKVFKFKV